MARQKLAGIASRSPKRTRQSGQLRMLLLGLFFCSGAAALGYQIVWTRLLTLGLGQEFPAVLAVVCAFMVGMAIGAGWLDRAIARSLHPGRWYGALEMWVALWAVGLAYGLPRVAELTRDWLGLSPGPVKHWTTVFVVPGLVLLPATVALGATFPAMDRFLASLSTDRRCVGAVYGANTAGAVVGTLAAAFVIVPWLGLRQSGECLAVISFACGVAAWVLGRRESGERATEKEAAPPESALPGSLTRARLMLTVSCTGLLGLGYETVSVRVLSQVLENTIYTYAVALAVFLAGTSAGAAIYQRWMKNRPAHTLLTVLLGALGTSCILGTLMMGAADGLYEFARRVTGNAPVTMPLAEGFPALGALALPTLLMGATFSHLVQSARRRTHGVGHAVAWNTLGGALATIVFSVLLLPRLGTKWTLALVAAGYLILMPQWRPISLAWVSACVVGLTLLPSQLHFVTPPPGGKLLSIREGVSATVAVTEDEAGQRALRVNARFQMGGTAAAHAEYRQGHLPLLLHAHPRRALFLGVGTGLTIGAAALYPDLETDGVELLPEVLQVLPLFEPQNRSPQRQPHMHLYTGDARRFARQAPMRYDVIVADLFHPARDGAGTLYTVEHFQAIRDRLNADGVFCQWLPLHQMDDETVRIIARTFHQVFPECQLWWLRFNVEAPVIGLVGYARVPAFGTDWLEGKLRTASEPLAEELRRLRLTDSIRMFGHLIFGKDELAEWTGRGPLNTDDRPVVMFRAPRYTYQRKAASRERLESWIARAPRNAAAALYLTQPSSARSFDERLARYFEARRVYLRGLVAEGSGDHTAALEAYVESARRSSDFTQGYARVLSWAAANAGSQPQRVRELLEQLQQARPEIPAAGMLLQRLPGP